MFSGKKLVSALVAAAFTMASYGPHAPLRALAADRDYLYMNEDFQTGYSVDVRLPSSGKVVASSTEDGIWSEAVERNGTPAGNHARIGIAGDNGNLMLDFYSGDGITGSNAQPRLSKSFAPGGARKFVLSFSAKKGDYNGAIQIALSARGTTRSTVMQLNNNANGGFVTDAGNAQYAVNTLEWNHYTVVMDAQGWTAGLWVNGAQVFSGRPIQGTPPSNDFDVASVTFAPIFMIGAGECHSYFDNVRVVGISPDSPRAALQTPAGAEAEYVVLDTGIPLDEAAVSPGSFTADGPAGTAAVSAVEYLTADRTKAKLIFAQPLAYEWEYTLHVAGARDILGRSVNAALSFTTRQARFWPGTPRLYRGSVADGNEMTELDTGSLLAGVSVKNELDEPREVALLSVLYGAAGAVEAFSAAGHTYAPGESGVLKTDAVAVSDTNGRTLKVFHWDNVRNRRLLSPPLVFGPDNAVTSGDAAAAPRPGVREMGIVDISAQTATVHTTLALAQAGQRVSVIVTDGDYALDDIDLSDPAAAAQIISYVNEGATNQNGVSVLTYGLSGEKSYLIHAACPDTGEAYTADFFFVSQAVTDEALVQANLAADSGAMFDVIGEHYRGLMLNLKEYRVLSEARQREVAAILLTLRNETGQGGSQGARRFASAQEANTVFRRALALRQLDLADSVSAVHTLLLENAPVLAFTAWATYAEVLTGLAVGAVDQAMLAVPAVTGLDMIDAFNRLVLLKGVEYTSGWSKTERILKDNPGVIGISASVLEAAPSSAYKAVTGRGYPTLDALREAFLLAYEGSQGGGAGGGGPSGAGGTVKTVVLPPAEPPAQERQYADLYRDLSGFHWAEEGITALTKMGIVHGKGGGLFAPQDSVTREELLKMLLEGLALTDGEAVSDYDDVSPDAWYYIYVSTAARLGITRGIGNGSFGAGQPVTRQDMAVFVQLAAQAAGVALAPPDGASFADEDEISGYAKNSVASMRAGGIIAGMEDGTFRPGEFCNRAQAAKVVYQLLRMAGLAREEAL